MWAGWGYIMSRYAIFSLLPKIPFLEESLLDRRVLLTEIDLGRPKTSGPHYGVLPRGQDYIRHEARQ
jgi:hypothetical protein